VSKSWRRRRHAWRLGRRRRDVERREQASARVGSGGAGAGMTRGTAQSGAGAVGARHMAGEGGRGGAEKKQRSRGWRKTMRTAL
jgi:hypothetical protein